MHALERPRGGPGEFFGGGILHQWLNSHVKVSEGNCGVRTELCMLNTCISVLSVSAYNVA